MIVVSRESSATKDGRKLCGCGCGRPRDREGQSYRRDCHAAYMRDWRRGLADAGMVRAWLTPDELEAVLVARAGILPPGRHRAS